MIDRSRARELLGETVREMGILLAVFVPIDAFFQASSVAPAPVAVVVVCALLFMAVGIVAEAQAKEGT